MKCPKEAKPTPSDRLIVPHFYVVDDIRFAMAAILDFQLQGLDLC